MISSGAMELHTENLEHYLDEAYRYELHHNDTIYTCKYDKTNKVFLCRPDVVLSIENVRNLMSAEKICLYVVL